MSPYTLQRAATLVTELDLEHLPTTSYPLDAYTAAFDAHSNGDHGKVIVTIPA